MSGSGFPYIPDHYGYDPRSAPILINTPSDGQGLRIAYPVPQHLVPAGICFPIPPNLPPSYMMPLPAPPMPSQLGSYPMTPVHSSGYSSEAQSSAGNGAAIGQARTFINDNITKSSLRTDDYAEDITKPNTVTLSGNGSYTLTSLSLPSKSDHETTVEMLILWDDDLVHAFPVHRELLCSFSPYFAEVFKERKNPGNAVVKLPEDVVEPEWRWKDKSKDSAEDNVGMKKLVDVEVVVKLPKAIPQHRLDPSQLGDVSAPVVAAFSNWLYNGASGFGLVPSKEDKITATTLIRLWVFAGKVGVPECQNDCLEAIEWWRQESRHAQVEDVVWVYEHTETGNKLRKLLRDQCIWLLGGGGAAEDTFPKEILLDLLEGIRSLWKGEGGNTGTLPFSREEYRKAEYHLPVEEKLKGEEVAEGEETSAENMAAELVVDEDGLGIVI